MTGNWRTDVTAENTEARAMLQRRPLWKHSTLPENGVLVTLDVNNYALLMERATDEMQALGKWYRAVIHNGGGYVEIALCGDNSREFSPDECRRAESVVGALMKRVRGSLK